MCTQVFNMISLKHLSTSTNPYNLYKQYINNEYIFYKIINKLDISLIYPFVNT